MKLVGCLVFLLMAIAGASQPQELHGLSYVSGNALFERCEKFGSDREYPPDEAQKLQADIGFCQGYIVAKLESTSVLGDSCPSKGVTQHQAVTVVVKYLTEHPELRDRSAHWLVYKALSGAFPCSK